MFDILDPETGKYENRFHLASIVGLLGPSQPEFLRRSRYSPIHFDDKGKYSISRICNHRRPYRMSDRQLEVSECSSNGVLG